MKILKSKFFNSLFLISLSATSVRAEQLPRSGMFAAAHVSYLSLSSDSKTYEGIPYGVSLGKDWALSSKLGLKTYFCLQTSTLTNSTKSSDQSLFTSPGLGIGINYSKFNAGGIASYHSMANGVEQYQYLGLSFETNYALFSGKTFQFQVGGSMGQTVYFSKSAVLLSFGSKLVWSMDN